MNVRSHLNGFISSSSLHSSANILVGLGEGSLSTTETGHNDYLSANA